MLDKISVYDLPSTIRIADGYDTRVVPSASSENIEYIIAKHNELVDIINAILDTKIVVGRRNA